MVSGRTIVRVKTIKHYLKLIQHLYGRGYDLEKDIGINVPEDVAGCLHKLKKIEQFLFHTTNINYQLDGNYEISKFKQLRTAVYFDLDDFVSLSKRAAWLNQMILSSGEIDMFIGVEREGKMYVVRSEEYNNQIRIKCKLAKWWFN